MSRISRTRLARGTKLTTQHVFNPQTDAATALSGRIDGVQMERPNGIFRITLPFPVLSGTHLEGTVLGVEIAEAGVSFPLPPPQDVFNLAGVVTPTTSVPVLESLMLSWDQRDESATIADIDEFNPGFLDFALRGFDVTVRLTRKRMIVFDATAPLVPEQEVFAVTIPALAVTSDILRQNPTVVPLGGRPLDPYSTYTLWVAAPNIGNHCLPSFTVSLRCRYPLHRRDVHSVTFPIRNMPTKHFGVQAPATVTVTPPAGNTVITAETVPTGLHTNLRSLDQVLLGGLQGGYSTEGDVGPSEHVRDDACYEVIAVPMHGGKGPIRGGVGGNVGSCAFSGVAPFAGPIIDRRTIPLTFPMVLHHVVALQDFSVSPTLAYAKVADNQTITRVGVGLGTGLRGDRYGYQQLAYRTWPDTDNDRLLRSIDRVKHQLNGTQSDGAYDQVLYSIPMVYPAAGPDGTGYPGAFNVTGRPIYCGRATTATQARTDIPAGIAGAVGPSAVAGEEQFIEVRWSFERAVGAGGLAGLAANSVLVGGAGHWVFLYFRKHLCGER